MNSGTPFGSADIPLPRPEDAEEWKSPSFSGDFYREVDNVCRGVTMPPADVVPGTSSYKDFGVLDGDFYRDPDDLCKDPTFPSFGQTDEFSKGNFFDDKLHLSSSIDYSSSLKQKDDLSKERFLEGDVPPPAPTDSFFKLEITTMYAATHVPFQLGNDLLDFFNSQAASLTKVRRPKFSIKADVYVDSMMCTLKARVYLQASGQFAIEFQRRSGDGICFNSTFQKASRYLGSLPHLALASSQAPMLDFQPLQLPAGIPEPYIDEDIIQPVLDMASKIYAPQLQAEAAQSLSRLAAEGKPAIRTTRVFQAISELLQSTSPDVAYPTAILVSQLAKEIEAAPLFAYNGLLLKILDKVRSPEMNLQVRRQFAQALCGASMGQSRATLPESDALTLIGEIANTVSQAQLDPDATQSLQMAEFQLRRQFEATQWA